jgi:hypothetical protein
MNREMEALFDEEFKQNFEAGVRAICPIEIGPNGCIKLETFIKIQQLISKCTHDTTVKRMAEHKKARRAFLKG